MAAILLEMDSYKFWTVFSGILFHSYWRTSSSCFRDVGGGNLFLTLVSKTDECGSMMFKFGNCAGRGSCRSSRPCFSNHDSTVPAVWFGAFSPRKTALLFGNNIWIVGCTWLPNLSMYSLAVNFPWGVIIWPLHCVFQWSIVLHLFG
jgi:hypothetical protein